MLERLPDAIRQELLAKEPVRGCAVVRFRQLAVIANVIVEGNLLRPMTASPPALAVARLVDDDTIDPGSESGVPAEGMDGAEDAEGDFLRQVERLVVVAQQVQGQLVG